jgi:hypothetical protein
VSRRNRRAAATARPRKLGGGHLTMETDPGGEQWLVRRIAGANAAKPYRCPGCDQTIALGSPHVVVWQPDRVDERRHWHSPCWHRATR